MIQKNKNKIIIDFNGSFYTRESIADTIKEFSKLCNINMNKKNNYFKLAFDCDDQNLVLEFSNYLLALNRVRKIE